MRRGNQAHSPNCERSFKKDLDHACKSRSAHPVGAPCEQGFGIHTFQLAALFVQWYAYYSILSTVRLQSESTVLSAGSQLWIHLYHCVVVLLFPHLLQISGTQGIISYCLCHTKKDQTKGDAEGSGLPLASTSRRSIMISLHCSD